MRKISPKPIAQFALLFSSEVLLSAATTYAIIGEWIPTSFRGIIAIVFFVVIFYALALAAFRLILHRAPLPTGYIEQGSPAANRVDLYLLHLLMLFNPLIFNRSIPVLFKRLLMQALGTRMGVNSYSSGTLLDPPLISIGDDTIIGFEAVVIGHQLYGDHFSLAPVRIGNRVTIGGHALIESGCVIGDDVTVALNSVVRQGTHIPAGELWGGTPARRLKPATPPAESAALKSAAHSDRIAVPQ